MGEEILKKSGERMKRMRMQVRKSGGAKKKVHAEVLDSSPGAVGMSMSGSRRGPLGRTPAP